MSSELRNKNAKLTDWGAILGGRIEGCTFADIDGVMERNGYMLFIEAKKPGESLSKAQAITMNALLGTGFYDVLILTVDEKNQCQWLSGYTCRGDIIDRKVDNRQFKRWVGKWLAWATESLPLGDCRLAAEVGYFQEIPEIKMAPQLPASASSASLH